MAQPAAQLGSIPAVLSATCKSLAELLDADGCCLSRVIGELLVDLVDHSPNGKTLNLGRGYLLSDYPLTAAVIESGEPKTVVAGDPDADPAEVALLRELGFDALLMLPLQVNGRCWGLVEVYRGPGGGFAPADVAAAHAYVVRTGELIERLQRPAIR